MAHAYKSTAFVLFFNPSGASILTDMPASCLRTLIKTTPPPPRYPLVPGGRVEPRSRGLALDCQALKGLEAKKSLKSD